MCKFAFLYAFLRPNASLYDRSLHTRCTRLATFSRLPSGKWRVQVRRRGRYLGETFFLRKDAELWARRIEREIDLGRTPTPKRVQGIRTFGDLMDLHLRDMKEVGKPIGRSKDFSMDLLKDRLGRIHLAELDRERLSEFGRERAAEAPARSRSASTLATSVRSWRTARRFTACRSRRSRWSWRALR